MLLSRRKKEYCQNCHYPLTGNYNFCPECGQENNEKIVSFNTLIGDFLSNYFSVDSRLGRSVKPFLFKPGFLTKEFIAGRRTKYMHPLRLYLVISFFYFLMFSFMISHETEDKKMLNFSKTNSEELDSASLTLGQNNPAVKVAANNQDVSHNDVPEGDSTKRYSGGFNFNSLRILVKHEVTPEEVLDSYNLEHNPRTLVLAKQAIKLANEREQNVYNYLIKNASIMMFLLLPFFAVLLKLFYVRRNKLYVEHITFTLHLHSFMFFVLFLVILIDYFWPNDDIVTIAVLIIFIYFLLSIKNVYQQSWGKTSVKMLFLTGGYAVSFLAFLIITVALSLYMY